MNPLEVVALTIVGCLYLLGGVVWFADNFSCYEMVKSVDARRWRARRMLATPVWPLWWSVDAAHWLAEVVRDAR